MPQYNSLMLIDGRDGKIGEDQRDDEDVVDAERFFQDVPGEKGEGGRLSVRLGVGQIKSQPVPLVGEIKEQIEEQGQTDPDTGPDECLAGLDHVGLSMEDPEVEGQQQPDQQDETQP